MKRTISLLVALVLILGLAIPSLSFSASKVDTIKSKVSEVYKKAYNLGRKRESSLTGGVFKNKNGDTFCSLCAGEILVAAGVIADYKPGNGNKAYSNYANASAKNGYNKTAFPGKNKGGKYTISQVCNTVNEMNKDGELTYILFGFGKGSTSNAGQKYGHALTVHCVYDGKVYYSEFNQAVCVKTINDFASTYKEKAVGSNTQYLFDGAVLFTKLENYTVVKTVDEYYTAKGISLDPFVSGNGYKKDTSYSGGSQITLYSTPSKKSATTSTKSVNSLFHVVAHVKNKSNEEWYKLEDGKFIPKNQLAYQYTVTSRTKAVYTANINTQWGKAPYDAKGKGTAIKVKSDVVVAMTVKNQYGNVWYQFDSATSGKWGYSGHFNRKCDYLAFVNVVYPKSFKINTTQGWFLAGGTVESSAGLKQISTQITDANGKAVSSKRTVNISGNSYSVKSLDNMSKTDNGVKFSKIKNAGTYYWVLTAKDAKDQTITLKMKFSAKKTGSTETGKASMKFGDSGSTVTAVAPVSLKFVDVVYPSTFKINTTQGWFLTGGKVESGIELASISSKIVNSSGTIISGEKTRNISGKSYTIKNLDTMESSDNGVKFSKIKNTGDYKWILTVKDKEGHSLKLEMPFKAVKTGSTATSKKSATYNSVSAASSSTGIKSTTKKETKPAQTTKKIVIDGLIYKLNLEKKTAAFTGSKDKNASSVIIPATINYKGKTHDVTQISKNACKDMKKLTKVTIGKNVAKIEADAFRGCSKLKTINIKTTKLTANAVDKNAFKGINKDATVNCPAKKLDDYQKLLTRKGISKAVTFK